MDLKRRVVIATVIAIAILLILVITPIVEDMLRSREITSSPIPRGTFPTSTIATPIPGKGEVIAYGCGESHTGADRLVVCPTQIYASKPGAIATINATVYFRHAQPCPYATWKILARNFVNVELVNESDTKIEKYIATKSFTIRVLGNGSLEVVFKYGTGCPYGTEEVVKVHTYVVEKMESIEKQMNVTTANTISSSETVNVSVREIEGIVEGVDLENKTIFIDGVKVYVRGKWICNSEEVKWRDLLSMIRIGLRIYVKLEDSKAIEISFNGYKCSRSR